MIIGDFNKIDLTTSNFKDIISVGNFYVDKTRMIENFLSSSNSVHLVARQRRLGKTLNMNMLRCFLTDSEDLRHLFKGLYVEESPVWRMANSAPVFYFDFKGLDTSTYKQQVVQMAVKHIYSVINPDLLQGYMKHRYESLINVPGFESSALHILTEIVHEATGKRSYLLIDEYDKLLMENFENESYGVIRNFMTALFSAAVKGNEYLEKALLTGVMRISHESMFSGLNNIVTYDVFNDDLYTDDYGFTEEEVAEIGKLADFDVSELRRWYNGVRVFGKPVYNTYSVMSFLHRRQYDCYWGKSGTMDVIRNQINEERRWVLAKLLLGERAEVPMENRVSLCRMAEGTSDEAFYSLLVQGGYLALGEKVPDKFSTYYVSLPNTELMHVWREFVLTNLFKNSRVVRTLFDHIDDLETFQSDLEYFLSDRLSYHDLFSKGGDEPRRKNERVYHVFLLGLLSAYEDTRVRQPASNAETGFGRCDVLVERPVANIIFEMKASKTEGDLEEDSQKALEQISAKRYGVDLNPSKRLVKVGIAFFGKKVVVKCAE